MAKDFIISDNLQCKLLEEINKEIRKIFRANGLPKPFGEQDFYNKLEQLESKNPTDGEKMQELSGLYDFITNLKTIP